MKKKVDVKFTDGGVICSTGYNYYGQLGHQQTYLKMEEEKQETNEDNTNQIKKRDPMEIQKDYACGNACDEFHSIPTGPSSSKGIVAVAAGEGHSLFFRYSRSSLCLWLQSLWTTRSGRPSEPTTINSCTKDIKCFSDFLRLSTLWSAYSKWSSLYLGRRKFWTVRIRQQFF